MHSWLEFFFTGFKQYNLTVQQLQSDLQSQVKIVQEKIANLSINVKGDQTAIFEHLLLNSRIIMIILFTYRYLPEPSQLMPTDSQAQPQ